MKVATAMIAMVLLMISLAGIGFGIYVMIGVPEQMLDAVLSFAFAPFTVGTIALAGLGVMFTVEKLIKVTKYIDDMNSAERRLLRKEGKV
jgi:hypothetical protein